MENINIEVVPRKYWMTCEKPAKVYERKSQKQVTSNIVALIVSCATENFPELENCKESSFLKFQEQVKNIILREMENNL